MMKLNVAPGKLSRNVLGLLVLGTTISTVNAQDGFNATISETGAGGSHYEVTMTWVHNPEKIFIADGVENPGHNSGDVQSGQQGKCNPDNTADGSTPGWGAVAPQDDIPWTMPRFFPKDLPAEITEKTGMKFASLDWQPCGHKDILICHAESHYDFHMYYVTQEELAAMQCAPGKPANMPTCPDTYDEAAADGTTSTGSNEAFYRLMKNNMIKSSTKAGVKKDLDFCVDPTSAMPASGIHYGDVTDTLDEWKEPVTILGSHDCTPTFFEAMFSYRWVRGFTKNQYPAEVEYPVFESGELEYDNKDYEPLPTSWSVEVGDACHYTKNTQFNNKECIVTVKVRVQKCAAGGTGCTTPLPRNCGQQKACKSSTMIGLDDNGVDPGYGTYSTQNQGDWESGSSDIATSSAWSHAQFDKIGLVVSMLSLLVSRFW